MLLFRIFWYILIHGYFCQRGGKRRAASESYDSRGQDIQVGGKEARITYSVVDNEGGGEKFKCDECDIICERSNLLRRYNKASMKL